MRSLLLTIFIACSLFTVQAQHVHGIRVDAGNNPVIVYLNGKQISVPTTSCFIANLRQGRYAIEVYDAKSVRPGWSSRGKLLYRESVRYRGQGIKDIVVRDCARPPFPVYPNDVPPYPDGYYPMNTLSPQQFDAFYRTLKEEAFVNAQLRMLERAVLNTNFTCAQCKRMIHLFNFDRERLKFMKLLYPVVVDKQNFFMVIKKLDFNSSKEEINRFIKDYHLRHRR